MKNTLIIALGVSLLTACTKEMDEVNPNTSGSTNQTSSTLKEQITRPFQMQFTTTVDPNPAIPPTPCTGDLPGFANAGLFVHGYATHIGQINSAQSRLQDVTCNLSFATGLLTTSIAGQIAAANGDLIYYTGNDEINVINLLTDAGPTGTITGEWTITGGTGRFEGASGSFTINGPVDFASASFSGTGNGTITY